MMMNEDLPEDLREYLHNLERKIAQLEKDLKKECAGKEAFRQSNKKLKKENEKLKKELARMQGSAPVLAGSDKTAEAGGVPTSKTFYRRNRQEGKKKPTGGQPGHPGHARKKPTPNSPPIPITLDKCPECGTPLGEPIVSHSTPHNLITFKAFYQKCSIIAPFDLFGVMYETRGRTPEKRRTEANGDRYSAS